MAVCAIFGLERLTAPLLTAVTLITLGTGVATAVEVGPLPSRQRYPNGMPALSCTPRMLF